MTSCVNTAVSFPETPTRLLSRNSIVSCSPVVSFTRNTLGSANAYLPPHLHLHIRNVSPDYSVGAFPPLYASLPPCVTPLPHQSVFVQSLPPAVHYELHVSGTLSTCSLPGPTEEAQNKNLLNAAVNSSEGKVKTARQKVCRNFISLTFPTNSKNSKTEATSWNRYEPNKNTVSRYHRL